MPILCIIGRCWTWQESEWPEAFSKWFKSKALTQIRTSNVENLVLVRDLPRCWRRSYRTDVPKHTLMHPHFLTSLQIALPFRTYGFKWQGRPQTVRDCKRCSHTDRSPLFISSFGKIISPMSCVLTIYCVCPWQTAASKFPKILQLICVSMASSQGSEQNIASEGAVHKSAKACLANTVRCPTSVCAPCPECRVAKGSSCPAGEQPPQHIHPTPCI